MKKTREELEAEIKRLQEELNPPAHVFIKINGKAQKIVDSEVIGKGVARHGKYFSIFERQYKVPVVIVKDEE